MQVAKEKHGAAIALHSALTQAQAMTLVHLMQLSTSGWLAAKAQHLQLVAAGQPSSLAKQHTVVTGEGLPDLAKNSRKQQIHIVLPCLL